MKAGKVTACPVCNVAFAQSQWRRIYCSADCAGTAWARSAIDATVLGRKMAIALAEATAHG
jgi:hypothetical protein